MTVPLFPLTSDQFGRRTQQIRHRTVQKFKLAEWAVRYFKYYQGVVRPKSVAGTPSTPSKKLLLVVLTNLRSSGGARLHHRFSFALA